MEQLGLTSLLFLGTAVLFGSTLAGTTGFGGEAVLLPILFRFFGVREAIPIPIFTFAQLIGNGSRVWFHRLEVNWSVVGWYALGAVPFAHLGGFAFSQFSFGIAWRSGAFYRAFPF